MTWPAHSEPMNVGVVGANGSIRQQHTVADLPGRVERVAVHTRRPGDLPASWANRVPGDAWDLPLLDMGVPASSESQAACADAINALGVGGLRGAT